MYRTPVLYVQKTLPILIHCPFIFMVSQARWPGVTVCARPEVSLTRQVKLFLFGDLFYSHFRLIIELVLYFLRGAKC